MADGPSVGDSEYKSSVKYVQIKKYGLPQTALNNTL
jgi:hypothetical protein